MTAEKRAEPTPEYSLEPWTTDPRHAHEALLDADGLRVADFHIFGRSTLNNYANARRVIDTAAERDRFQAANVELVDALGKAAKAFDIAISLTPTGPHRNRLCDMNIDVRAVLDKHGDQS